MNSAVCFVCDDCGAEIDLRQPVNLCPHCGGMLEVRYDPEKMKQSADVMRHYQRGSIWRYRDFFPAVSDGHIVTLGEGGTPLVKSRWLGPSLGIENLYFKNDTLMPTGSFKDRGFSLAVSYASEIGVKRGLTYSSGNAGASFSAYSARAGFPGLVLVEYLASDTKKAMILLYGAKAAILEYENFDQISAMLDGAVQELGCYMFVNFINPVRHEAMKTYAYEIYGELGRVPDYSFHPVGTGGGLWGTWKGYQELAAMGVTDKLPHMVGVQPSAVCWLKQAIDTGAQEGSLYGDSTKTIAQSISGNSPLHGGRRLLSAVRNSGGMAMAVTDEEILEAMRDLGREGIGAEPSSAAGVAAFKQAAKAGKIRSTDTAVCVITGTALKQPAIVQRATNMPQRRVRADVDALRTLLEEYKMG
ncbi:MAG: pyridoxal-phosphate dependent enzyme [Candidatus Limiplasma sp.]|nr:pyridoxal-phosphate dependent enzyme [Clostridiales bacterium]MDY3816475.1 pyridoxal-phosphate dependent enzyme [Candidatus Limiplasma sp.]